MKHKKENKSLFTIRNVIRVILMFISSGLLFVGIIYLISTTYQKQTIVKCMQLEQYSKELTGFWITANDKVECGNVGITLEHIEVR